MISSVHNQTIVELSKLHLKKHRDQTRRALVDGAHLIEEAYKAQVLEHVYGRDDVPFYHDVPYTQVSEAVMRKLCSTTSLSLVVGVIRMLDPRPLGQHICVLDGVQDPGNVGTILRSASAFDFTSIILLNGCADPYNPKAIAASQGALFHVSIHPMSVEAFETFCKSTSHQVLVSDVHQAQSLKTIVFEDACMLVLGSEGAGVSERVKACATSNVKIMTHTVESLNVAIAGSILMHAHFSRKC